MTNSLSLDHIRPLVDEQLRTLFERRRQQAGTIDDSYGQFWTRIEQVATAGGKRIRPYLTMIGNGAYDERVLPVAVAQELIHIAMLMHDDIIDHDTLRHGEKNMTGLYIDTYGPHAGQSRALHYANSAAMLAGDALISEAYRLIDGSKFDSATKQKLTDQLGVSVFEVIGGELLDVEAGFITGTPHNPLTIYRYKTSSYSFIGPLLSGAYCSGANAETLATLERFATNIGIAFQIQDDLLGVFGNEEVTGKSTLADLIEGKQTLLVLYHKEHMTPVQAERFAWFGNAQAATAQLEAIKRDMTTSGARQKTTDHADRYFAAAKDDLRQLPADDRTAELIKLIDKLEGRRR